MAIYFPDGNGGRKLVDGFGGGSSFSLSDLKLTGFSEVADATGALEDEDTLLVVLAKFWNRQTTQGSSSKVTVVRTPRRLGKLI